jgi:3-phosphoshikimate 1-carboxyvinyltransferase
VKAVVEPSRVSGAIRAPQSKSYAIRYIFLSLLTDVELFNLVEASDVIDAINAVSVFGVKRVGERFLKPPELSLKSVRVFIKGSATVLRMLIPIAAVVGGRLYIDGGETLRKRPLKSVVKALSSKGVKFSGESLPLVMDGRLRDNHVELEGAESSQYISGFMYAFALSGGGTVAVRPSIPSKLYVYITAQVLSEVGVKVRVYEGRVEVDAVDRLSHVSTEVPGDFLLASFYVVAALLTGGEVEVYGLPKPGRFIEHHPVVDVFKAMGAQSLFDNGVWRASASDTYRGIAVDIEQDPDIAPPVAALASVAEGETLLINASRLRIKESDRVETISSVLRSFGTESWFDGSSLHIVGGSLRRARIACPDDHRIAMMAAAMAAQAGGEVDGAECVDKSNPSFWWDLMRLGARIALLR